jgi:hypothetical protein
MACSGNNTSTLPLGEAFPILPREAGFNQTEHRSKAMSINRSTIVRIFMERYKGWITRPSISQETGIPLTTVKRIVAEMETDGTVEKHYLGTHDIAYRIAPKQTINP